MAGIGGAEWKEAEKQKAIGISLSIRLRDDDTMQRSTLDTLACTAWN